MKKMQNDQSQQAAGSMLSQKTNEDFNKQKPDPNGPNFKAIKTYTCPMHPEVKLDKRGKCPTCGMELIEKKQRMHGSQLTGRETTREKLVQPPVKDLRGTGDEIFNKHLFWRNDQRLCLDRPDTIVSGT